MNLTSESLVGAQSLAMSISARLPRIGSPGTGRLDVGQQRVDPLVAGLAMVSYAHALYNDPSASLDDLREAVTTLEDAERIARRVLGGAHPVMVDMERSLRVARAALRAREAQPGEA